MCQCPDFSLEKPPCRSPDERARRPASPAGNRPRSTCRAGPQASTCPMSGSAFGARQRRARDQDPARLVAIRRAREAARAAIAIRVAGATEENSAVHGRTESDGGMQAYGRDGGLCGRAWSWAGDRSKPNSTLEVGRRICNDIGHPAPGPVAKSVDAANLKFGALRRAGSIPAGATISHDFAPEMR